MQVRELAPANQTRALRVIKQPVFFRLRRTQSSSNPITPSCSCGKKNPYIAARTYPDYFSGFKSPQVKQVKDVFRLLPRRELELKMIKTGVLCTELVGGWSRKGNGGGGAEHRRSKRAIQGRRFKRWARSIQLFPWSFFQ